MYVQLNQLFVDNFWLLFTFAFVCVLFYWYVLHQLNYWTRLGLSGPKPLPIIGTLYQVFFYPLNEMAQKNVKKYGLVYGTYFLHKPQLNIADAELAKCILIKDFNKFVNHIHSEWQDPLIDRSIVFVEDDDWRMMREAITPAFSSSKMRKMHHLVERCVDDLEAFVKKAAETKTEVKLKQLAGNFTMQVIALCAFATRVDVYNDPDNQFITNLLKTFEPKVIIRFILVNCLLSLPFINHFINIPIYDSKISGFFKNATKEIIKKRSGEENKHHDLLQLLVEAQKKNEIDNKTDAGNGKKSKIFGKVEVYANAFIFFLAGYETSHNLFSFFFYMLALHDDVQEKLYQEVMKHANENGIVDYENIQQMIYLDACVSETLRLYNPVIEANRTAGEDYILPGTDIHIKKGQMVNIQIDAIHHNPEYYPNPYKFDPTRFLPENKHNLVPFTYLPFSAGPRNCLGLRFALMEVKTAIIRQVNRFRFLRTTNTPDHINFKKFVVTLTASQELPVGVELR